MGYKQGEACCPGAAGVNEVDLGAVVLEGGSVEWHRGAVEVDARSEVAEKQRWRR